MTDTTGPTPLRAVYLGDIVGRPGRHAVKAAGARLLQLHPFDLLLVNGENAAGGLGLSTATARELFEAGVAVISLGDHAWKQKDAEQLLARPDAAVLRPANYPAGAPGRGWLIASVPKLGQVGVFNLLGRTFTGALVDCPFRAADAIINGPLAECRVRICDFHAEATSEKAAMASHLDGRVSLLVGTHTHVQTADERVLPGGTAFITDLGMCGSTSGVIGMEAASALQRFITGRPSPYKVAQGPAALCGIWCAIDPALGKALEIKRVRLEVAAP